MLQFKRLLPTTSVPILNLMIISLPMDTRQRDEQDIVIKSSWATKFLCGNTLQDCIADILLTYANRIKHRGDLFTSIWNPSYGGRLAAKR